MKIIITRWPTSGRFVFKEETRKSALCQQKSMLAYIWVEDTRETADHHRTDKQQTHIQACWQWKVFACLWNVG